VRDRARDLGLVRMAAGDLAAARDLFTESCALARRTGNEGMEAMALLRLAALDRLEGRLASARARLGRACALAESTRVNMARFRSGLGSLARTEGRFAEAEAILREELARSLAGGDQLVTAEQLCWLGILRVAQGRHAEGVRLIGAGAVANPGWGSIHTPDLRLEVEPALGRARAALGDRVFEVALGAGQAMTPERAAARDLATRDPHAMTGRGAEEAAPNRAGARAPRGRPGRRPA